MLPKNLLRHPQDAILLILWTLLGILPSGMLFFWIERNCALPLLPQTFGWPWILVDGSTLELALFDALLILLFGVAHSVFAHPPIRNLIFGWTHPKNHRALYVILTGIASFLLMAHWQQTGVVLYALFSNALFSAVISFLLFWGITLSILKVGMPLGILKFLGLEDLLKSPADWDSTEGARSSGPAAKLVISGAYARVRHPLYSLTLTAIVLTPFLSLDRLIVFLMFLSYILVGYRIEERKLVREFGTDYLEYRKKTPALFPIR